LHDRWRKAFDDDAGSLQFCLKDRVFTPEESNCQLSELGIDQGSVLTVVVSPDVEPGKDTVAALCWLKDHADLNGTLVRVTEYHQDLQRYEVRSVESELLFRVRRENLLARPNLRPPQLREELVAGAMVRFVGLKNDASFNGTTAVILEVDVPRARYSLRLQDGSVKIARGANS